MNVPVIHPTKRGLLGVKVILALTWVWAVLAWMPAVLCAPLVLALGWLLDTMGRGRAGIALRWFISIPETWAHTEYEGFMIAHAREHLNRQRRMGVVRYVLRWLTARGCVEFETEAYAHDVALRLRRRDDGDKLCKTWTRHYAGVIKTRYWQVRRSEWSITEIETILAVHVGGILTERGWR